VDSIFLAKLMQVELQILANCLLLSPLLVLVSPYVFVGLHPSLPRLALEKGFNVIFVAGNQPLRLSKPQVVLLKYHFMLFACLHS
jgi:hypothetical protein